ncbi:MAG: hypothetical protein EBU08_10205 [Micrococcales bacterium]|nr:hypothetical protein [Micrococcales bacterium]
MPKASKATVVEETPVMEGTIMEGSEVESSEKKQKRHRSANRSISDRMAGLTAKIAYHQGLIKKLEADIEKLNSPHARMGRAASPETLAMRAEAEGMSDEELAAAASQLSRRLNAVTKARQSRRIQAAQD